MSRISALRRLLLCGLTLCVAGAGAAPFALPRPAEPEIETHAEVLASLAAACRDTARELRQAVSVARSVPFDSRPASRRPATDAALRPTLRTLEVRLQV